MKKGGMLVERIYGNKRTAWNLFRGLVLAGIVSMISLLILAFVMLKLQMDVGQMEIGILLTYALSCLAGGWYCGRKSEKRKFIWGLLTGILYFLLLFLISRTGEDAGAADFMQGLTAFALCAAGGMLGGMLAG